MTAISSPPHLSSQAPLFITVLRRWALRWGMADCIIWNILTLFWPIHHVGKLMLLPAIYSLHSTGRPWVQYMTSKRRCTKHERSAIQVTYGPAGFTSFMHDWYQPSRRRNGQSIVGRWLVGRDGAGEGKWYPLGYLSNQPPRLSLSSTALANREG